MTRKILPIILFCLISVSTFGAAVAVDTLPDTSKTYVDPDSAAMAVGPRIGDKAAWRRHLNQVLQKYPKDVVTLCNRAYVRNLAGDFEGANEDYLKALKNAEPSSAQYRHILWSIGWSQFNLGDDAGALNSWAAAERQHGGAPYWVPYTVALSYWRLGKKDLSLAYYLAAVNYEAHWGTEAGIDKMTHHWKPTEKKVHAEIFAEYKKHLLAAH